MSQQPPSCGKQAVVELTTAVEHVTLRFLVRDALQAEAAKLR